MNSTPLSTDAPTRRRQLRKITPSDTPCGVPGCAHGRVIFDCCYHHALVGPGETGAWTVPNDGIIDWLAIDVATRGLRKVRLTWVEKDIAVGTILARGGGIFEAQEFVGARVSGSPRSRRVLAAQAIAEALNRTSNGGQDG